MSERDITDRIADCLIFTRSHKMDGLTTALQDARDEIVALLEWKETVRDIFDYLILPHGEHPDTDKLLDIINKRHRPYFWVPADE